jgi:hypothetical protein
MLRALAGRGFRLASAASDWVIAPAALEMLRELVSGTAESALRAMPARRAAILDWEGARMRQALASRLAIRIGHRDILAIPGEG